MWDKSFHSHNKASLLIFTNRKYLEEDFHSYLSRVFLNYYFLILTNWEVFSNLFWSWFGWISNIHPFVVFFPLKFNSKGDLHNATVPLAPILPMQTFYRQYEFGLTQ